jgi:hypothetical protein
MKNETKKTAEELAAWVVDLQNVIKDKDQKFVDLCSAYWQIANKYIQILEERSALAMVLEKFKQNELIDK